MVELAEGSKNCRQLLIQNIFEQLWKVDQKTKGVHYFDNSNRIFFFGAKISKAWLKIRSKFGCHVEGATCQQQIGL